MRVFTMHTRPWSAAPDQDAVSVKEGFCWPAALVPLLWALWHRLWLPVVAAAAVLAVVPVLAELTNIDPVAIAAIEIAPALLFGFLGNDWRRRVLTARGYVESGVVAGRDRAAAEHRYFCMMDTDKGAS